MCNDFCIRLVTKLILNGIAQASLEALILVDPSLSAYALSDVTLVGEACLRKLSMAPELTVNIANSLHKRSSCSII